MGATKEGKLVAAESTLIYEAGGVPRLARVPPGAQCMMAQYDVPNAHLVAYDVVINRPKSAAYRAPGAPASAFAMETAIDELCEKLEMDPMEFRLLNSSKDGVRRVTGPMTPKVGYIETLQALKDHPHFNTPLEGRTDGKNGHIKRGRGRGQRLLGQQYRPGQRPCGGQLRRLGEPD